jgi:HK97 family phage major capsid protein
MNVHEYLNAVEEVSSLSAKPTLSTREVQKQNALLAAIAAAKAFFTPEQIRDANRDRTLREAGLPRNPEAIRRRVPASVDREWRNFGLGKDVRLTYVPDDMESRANVAGTESITYTQTAGRFVPQGMWPRYLESAKHADELFDPANHFELLTDTGNPTSVPSADDVSVSSVQVGEGLTTGETDVANFGTSLLGAWSQRSRLVVISRELLQDTNYPFSDVIELIFAKRFARGVGALLVNGSGVNTLTGLLTAAIASGANITIATGSATNDGSANTGSNSIGTNDFVNCMKGLDPAYWSGAKWMMNPATLLAIWSQLDKSGRPLMNDLLSPGGMGVDRAPYILGHPVVICPSMPVINRSANSVVLFHPDYFIVRKVPSSMYVRRFDNAAGLIEKDLVGFEAFYRTDSNLSAPNASFAPVSIIQHHS